MRITHRTSFLFYAPDFVLIFCFACVFFRYVCAILLYFLAISKFNYYFFWLRIFKGKFTEKFNFRSHFS